MIQILINRQRRDFHGNRHLLVVFFEQDNSRFSPHPAAVADDELAGVDFSL
jgi:hypothetical protein